MPLGLPSRARQPNSTKKDLGQTTGEYVRCSRIAVGAEEEVTNPSKPLMSRTALGDSASMQAGTRVNVERAAKRIDTAAGQPAFGEMCHLPYVF
jgi:hypothetical protein